MDMTASEKITKARAGLILDQPFFGALALRLEITEDKTCDTGWTNGVQLGYNPEWIDTLTLAQTKGFWAHEVMHVACAHHARRQSRDHNDWNEATDYAIDPLIEEAGLVLPSGAHTGYDKTESAESIYSQLAKDKQQGQDQPGDDNQQPGNDPGQGEGQGQGDPGGNGGVRDYPGNDAQPATQAELAQAEGEAKVAVQQAATIAKSWGSLSAGLERFIEEIMKPQIPWQEILRRFFDEITHNDYTWVKPNPRYMAAGFYLPSLYSQEIKSPIIIVDTSGSQSQEALNQCAGEISGIQETVKVDITVMYVDSRLKGIQTFTPDEQLILEAKGGGGTDFRPGFDLIEEQQLDPSCVIYLTDGCCNKFPEEPAYPVLWGKIGGYDFDPPFGEVMEIIE